MTKKMLHMLPFPSPQTKKNEIKYNLYKKQNPNFGCFTRASVHIWENHLIWSLQSFLLVYVTPTMDKNRLAAVYVESSCFVTDPIQNQLVMPHMWGNLSFQWQISTRFLVPDKEYWVTATWIFAWTLICCIVCSSSFCNPMQVYILQISSHWS